MDFNEIDQLIYNEFNPLIANVFILMSLILVLSIILRYAIYLIVRELKVYFTLKKRGKSRRREEPNVEEDYSVLLNVYVPDSTVEMNHLRMDRGLTEFNIEGEDGVNLGMKNYIVDIKQLPQNEIEMDELEKRKEQEFERFLKNLSEAEKSKVKEKLGDMVSEKDLISHQELYLVFKGIEREYRLKMIEQLNKLEKNYLQLKGRIVRSGVSENNSILFMKRFRMLRREVEVYKMIIEHKSLLRKLIEIDNHLQRLQNDYPFLVHGYNTNTRVTRKNNPINRGDSEW